METYNIWHENGKVETINTESPLRLEDLQKIVGGYIEVVTEGKTQFVCDEEGRIKGKAVNPAFPTFVGTVITTQGGVK